MFANTSLPARAPRTWLWGVVGGIVRAIEARAECNELAALSERERQDIGWTRRDECGCPPVVNPADEEARRVALRAWYGQYKRAA